MLVRRLALAALALTLALAPAGAQAHNADPNYLTTLGAVTPAVPGLEVQILNRGDRLLVVDSGVSEPVTIMGYNDDPYVRVGPGKRIDVNTNSPAYYLNQDRFGTTQAPANVTGEGAPKWKNVSVSGRYEWHDHRIHWMGSSRPKQVTDPDKKQKIYDWKIPVKAGSQTGAITGTLFWTPKPGGPMPVWAIALLVALVLASLVIGVRGIRRRTAGADGPDTPAEPREAW